LKKRIALFTLLFAYFASGQTVRKYSNEFMNIGVDAAALGMANAVTATTNNVNSGYWNPAGLLHVEGKEIGLMHASYFANIAQYDYAAFAMPIDEKSAFAFSMIRFGVDDILNTTQLIDANGTIDYNRISLFSAADYGFTFSYARKSPIEGLHYGVNAKIIRRVIGSFANSWGLGFDVGAQYRYKKWQIGAMLRDATTTYNAWTINESAFEDIRNAIPGQNQELPENSEITLPKMQIGIARSFEINADYQLLTAFNANMRFTRTNDWISSERLSIDPALGFQFSYVNMVFLRGGVGNFQQVQTINQNRSLTFQPNIGLGFYYKGISLDYALTDIGDQSLALYSNIFSLRVQLDAFLK
jgi:hypothetical protein